MNILSKAVEKHKKLILDAERYIWNNPETGYKEVKTSKYLATAFERLGYNVTLAKDITGFYTVFDTGIPGPEILVLAELDSVICPTHKEADPETGAVHACGHNAQCAALLGLAAALKEDGVKDCLCGRIKLCAVPAEELLEIEFRQRMKNEGRIKYFGGKTEFLHRGYFDGVDIAFMVHTSEHFSVRNGSSGFIAKNIIYNGVSAHAGSSPWNGKNALYAASCALNAINALRETFREADLIRVHPIITSGGEIVNAIPETVKMESYVRGKSFDAMIEANKRVNKALCGAAISLDLNVEIIDFPGYAPLINDKNLMLLTKDAADKIIPDANFVINDWFGSGSTDMGELSAIMPVVHPYAAGAVGKPHGNDYYITDPEKACVDSAKMQLSMLYLLLKDNASHAKRIIKDFKPMFTSKSELLDYIDKINSSGERIEYTDSGIHVKL